uniref:Uncharacterized protein n=1 Tax=Candidatus Kentrum sp. LPFa TaxID=2126335 RepID=A0A450WFA9_9GAMM|nr:MAG: hypothetical protein BECKLPF1236B_GA0070989_108218 [Candidatus Kentron sp. LPFa]
MEKIRLNSFIFWCVQTPLNIFCEIHWHINWFFILIDSIPMPEIKRKLDCITNHLFPSLYK